MKLKILFLSLISVLFLNNNLQQKDIDKAEEIVKKSNFHISLLLSNQKDFIHLYFVNSKVSIKNNMDRVFFLNSNGNIKEGYTGLNYLTLDEGEVYLSNNNGKLLFNGSFENLLLPQRDFSPNYKIDPERGIAVFDSYSMMSSNSFKPLKSTENSKLYINSVGEIADSSNNLIIAKHNGKWGAINFDGKIISEFKYKDYKIDTKGIISFWNNKKDEISLLNKTDFLNKPSIFFTEIENAEIQSYDIFLSNKEKGILIQERVKINEKSPEKIINNNIRTRILNAPEFSLLLISSIKAKYKEEIKDLEDKTYFIY